MVSIKMLRAVGGYDVGDEREVSQADAKRLVDRGIAERVAEKADKKRTSNKAEGASSGNKADVSGVTKSPAKTDK